MTREESLLLDELLWSHHCGAHIGPHYYTLVKAHLITSDGSYTEAGSTRLMTIMIAKHASLERKLGRMKDAGDRLAKGPTKTRTIESLRSAWEIASA